MTASANPLDLQNDPRAAVEARLDALLAEGAAPADLSAAMRHTVLAPGKRVRPLLTILLADAAGFEGPDAFEAAVDAGCAAEMVHASSLILDDLPCMDDAKTRRGRPCVHVAFSESTAILAAVALLNRSFGVLAALPGVGGDVRAAVAADLADAVGTDGLIGGQMGDLANTGRASRAAVERINAQKTGALFRFSILAAARLAGVKGGRLSALEAFADEFGLAFQLQDDLRDIGAAGEAAGKDIGKDAGKATLVALDGAAAVRQQVIARKEAALASLSAAGFETPPLAALIAAQFDAVLRYVDGA